MARYLAGRLAFCVVLLLVISWAAFFVMHLAPGDPLAMYVDPEKGFLAPDEKAILRHNLGLDRPLVVQYVYWLGNCLQGDWGYSLRSRLPVMEEVLDRLPNTLLLSGIALVAAVAIALPIGTITAVRRYGVIDYGCTIAAFAGISIPSFFFAMLVVWLFSVELGWLPSTGMHSFAAGASGAEAVWDVIRHLILPAAVLSLREIASWTRYQRSSVLDVLNQDYMRTARAKGLRETRLIVRHGVRNALIPMVTLAGLSLPELVGGSFVVETIFAWPGMGRLGVLAIQSRDFPIVMGVTMVTSTVVLAGNLLADILYAWVDPRIHYD